MPARYRSVHLDTAGATAIEYAMVAFFVSIAAFVALQQIGTSVTNVFQSVANSL